MLRLAMVALTLAQCPLAAQTAAKISGKITDSATRQPIPKVHVSCMVGSQFVGALTGVDGAYTLENVPAGAVRMLVNLDGYMLIDQRTDVSAGFVIAAGDALKRDFEMHPLGRIFGTLVDRESGKAIPLHAISAVRKHYYPGHVAYDSTIAEQKGGEFQIRNLEPGDYVIQIEPVDEVAIVFPAEETALNSAANPAPKEATANSAPKRYYGQRWYPDVPRIEMAAPIHVSEGESRRVDISLENRETHTLSGTIQAPHGFERAPVKMALRSDNTRQTGTTPMRAPGPFRIEHLAPGAYRLSVTAGNPPNVLVADCQLEISRHDIEGFKVQLAPPSSVIGEVRMAEEGAKLPARLGIFFMVPVSGWVALLKGGGMLIGGDMPVSGSDVTAGKFHQESIRPGEYWPVLLDLPAGYAVERVVFEGVSARSSAMTLSAPETPIAFVITSRPGTVVSVVRDEKQNVVRGAWVALLPDPLPDKVGPGAIRVEETGDDGAFVFRDVAPGMYRAVVLTGPDSGEQGDVVQLRELAARVDAFEVREGQPVSISLKRY